MGWFNPRFFLAKKTMESGSGANALEAWAAAEARRGRSWEPRVRAKAKTRGGWMDVVSVF